MLEPTRRQPLVRALNVGDRLLRGAGLRGEELTPRAVKAAAAAATGLDDFGPPDYEEGLAVFCRSAIRDARLDLVGRTIVSRVLRRVLSNRLLLVHHLQQHPEVFERPLVPPLIVLGLPRTGTTYLHRLLAQDPAAYGPPAWQVWRPLPRVSGPDRRREITLRALEEMRRLSPALDVKHYQDADEPEECYHLMDPSLRAPGLSMLCQAWGYFNWVRQQDMAPAYRVYRQYLQILQGSAPGRRLTLKTPLHTAYMEQIVAEIPGVRFVQTHRDVAKSAGSMASLFCSMFALTSDRLCPEELGTVALELLCWLARTCLQARERSELPVVDVQYADLVSDPVGTVRRIYDEHGLPWSEAVEAAVARGARDRPQHKQGAHRYELSDFGLDRATIERNLGDYIERFMRA